MANTGVAPVISLCDVSFCYPGAHAGIHGVSLDIPAGQVTGIIGPNGCGKSTLLKLAVGLLNPDQGRVLMGGQDVSKWSAKKRARHMSYMAQMPLTTAMTVEELVMCGRYAHGGLLQHAQQHDRDIAEQAMHDTDVLALRRARLHELSGGQRQRAHMAMMLAQQAHVMLLDEPFSALDIHAAHAMMLLCRDIVRSSNVGIAVVVHDLDMAFRYCNQVVVMHEGTVVAQGPSHEIAASPLIEEVFQVQTVRNDTPHGTSYSFFTSGEGFGAFMLSESKA